MEYEVGSRVSVRLAGRREAKPGTVTARLRRADAPAYEIALDDGTKQRAFGHCLEPRLDDASPPGRQNTASAPPTTLALAEPCDEPLPSPCEPCDEPVPSPSRRGREKRRRAASPRRRRTRRRASAPNDESPPMTLVAEAANASRRSPPSDTATLAERSSKRQRTTRSRFLEVFSGTRVLEREMARYANWDVVSVDASAQHQPTIRVEVLETDPASREWDCAAAHFAPPCQTFSKLSGGKHRSADNIYGWTPEAAESNAIWVWISNVIRRQLSRNRDFRFTIEQPESTLLLQFPPVATLLEQKGVALCKLSPCMLADPPQTTTDDDSAADVLRALPAAFKDCDFRKPTFLITNVASLVAVFGNTRLSHRRFQYLCPRTRRGAASCCGRRHFCVRGAAAISASYSPRLTYHLAHHLNAEVDLLRRGRRYHVGRTATRRRRLKPVEPPRPLVVRATTTRGRDEEEDRRRRDLKEKQLSFEPGATIYAKWGLGTAATWYPAVVKERRETAHGSLKYLVQWEARAETTGHIEYDVIGFTHTTPRARRTSSQPLASTTTAMVVRGGIV